MGEQHRHHAVMRAAIEDVHAGLDLLVAPGALARRLIGGNAIPLLGVEVFDVEIENIVSDAAAFGDVGLKICGHGFPPCLGHGADLAKRGRGVYAARGGGGCNPHKFIRSVIP